MGTQALILALLLSACGDNIIPPTWGEAVVYWAEGWCEYYRNCFPGDFEHWAGSTEVCIVRVVETNCTLLPCEETFPQEPPDRWSALEACRLEMLNLSCDADNYPYACRYAFQ